MHAEEVRGYLSLRPDFRVASLGTHETAVSQGLSTSGFEFHGDTTRLGSAEHVIHLITPAIKVSNETRKIHGRGKGAQ